VDVVDVVDVVDIEDYFLLLIFKRFEHLLIQKWKIC
jgi:hypothetical protein